MFSGLGLDVLLCTNTSLDKTHLSFSPFSSLEDEVILQKMKFKQVFVSYFK